MDNCIGDPTDDVDNINKGIYHGIYHDLYYKVSSQMSTQSHKKPQV